MTGIKQIADRAVPSILRPLASRFPRVPGSRAYLFSSLRSPPLSNYDVQPYAMVEGGSSDGLEAGTS